jgi:hydrogenase-4 membrane subunit HyfE
MEHISIISKEAITQPVQWPFMLVGVSAIILVAIFVALAMFKEAKNDREGSYCWTMRMLITGVSGIVTMLFTLIICSIFFRVPTGQYKYEATVDKENITVEEYERFIEEYNPTFKDGVYYWEGE